MKFIYFLCYLFPTLLLAQSDSIKTLPRFEVTSQRLNRFAIGQNRIDFDSFTLKTVQNQNLADFLQNNTPLSIKAYGTGLATVSTRGTGSSHTAIVWNGFNLQNPLNGLTDLPLFEAGAFEKMGVKFGGSSALYGSGAIGGAIYLDNIQEEKQGFHAHLGFKTGSFGLFGENLKISTSSEKVSANFRLSHQSATNDFIFKNTAEIGQPLQRLQNAAYEKLNFTANLFFNLNKNNTLKIHGWDSRNDRQLAPTMTANNDKALLKDATSRLAVEYGHFKNHPIGTLTEKHTKLRVAYFDEDNFYKSTVIDSSRNRAKTIIAEIEHNIDYNNKNALRFGANFTQNTALTNNFNETKTRNRLATFAAYQFQILKTKFGITARQELVDKKLIPFTFSLGFEKQILFTKNPHTPTANYPLSIFHFPLILRGSLSRNHNLPALNDLYWTQLGNPNLKAENGFSGELGVDFKLKQSKLSLTAFGMKTKDQIQWSPQADGLWHPTNINTVFSRGLETLFSTNFKKGG